MRNAANTPLPQKALKLFLGAAFLAILSLPFLYRPAPPVKEFDAPLHASGSPRTLIIISPHWEGIRREFSRAFSRWSEKNLGYRTDIEWLDVGGSSDAVRYVRSEFKRAPGGINVDMFFGGGVDPYLQFKKEGLLQPCRISAPVLGRIPAVFSGIELYDPDRQWFGVCLSGFGIIYNKKVLELLKLPEPRAWTDLAASRYFSWVGSGDPRSSGSVHMAYEIILQAYGWERGWPVLLGMGGNIRNFSRSASDVPKDTALGEIACGLAIDVYAWRQVAEAGTDRIGFLLPEGLTVISPDGIAMLKGAPHADLAAKFIEFTLSEEGQKLWVLRKGTPGGPQEYELGRMPVIPGFAKSFGKDAAVPLDPFQWKGGFTYDAAKGSERWNLLNDLIGAVLIDNHRELAAAWDAVRMRDGSDPLVRELTKPPLTEEEAMRLARAEWTQPVMRSKIRSRWSAEAKARYLTFLEKP
ncbi:MAG: extracellular solute-binding protein [Deltaproteobacteria bacterium]|nr:extracellular solute-binding protein [Deltaproteobacteria bacterium]